MIKITREQELFPMYTNINLVRRYVYKSCMLTVIIASLCEDPSSNLTFCTNYYISSVHFNSFSLIFVALSYARAPLLLLVCVSFTIIGQP